MDTNVTSIDSDRRIVRIKLLDKSFSRVLMNAAIQRIKLRMYIDTKAVDVEHGSNYEYTPFVQME